MAKQTYLALVNTILRRISQSTITDVTAATGHAKIVCDLFNEAQNALFVETNWYSLYKTRQFTTTTYTVSTIAFTNANPDTITDSANGFGSFQSGQHILVTGSTSNDGTYYVSTAAAGTLTLQLSDSLTVESAGASVTITAITYPVASDWGRTIDLADVSNNTMLTEDVLRAFDEADPNADYTGTPTHFSLQGAAYRLYPMVAGAYKIRERYWMAPTSLSANTSTSDLPIECENILIHWAWYKILEYMNKFEQADRLRIETQRLLSQAKSMNDKMIDKMHVMSANMYHNGLQPPRFPSHYGRMY